MKWKRGNIVECVLMEKWMGGVGCCPRALFCFGWWVNFPCQDNCQINTWGHLNLVLPSRGVKLSPFPFLSRPLQPFKTSIFQTSGEGTTSVVIQSTTWWDVSADTSIALKMEVLISWATVHLGLSRSGDRYSKVRRKQTRNPGNKGSLWCSYERLWISHLLWWWMYSPFVFHIVLFTWSTPQGSPPLIFLQVSYEFWT